jgi:hypothetical protein
MNPDRMDAVREVVEAWARRPPRRSAAVARTRVLAQLEAGRQRPRLSIAALVSAVVGLGLGLFLLAPRWPFGVKPETAAVVPSGAFHQPLLVYELSSGTTLYLTLSETSAAMSDEPEKGQGEES